MKLIFKIYVDNRLYATEATQELAKQTVKNMLYMWRHRTREPFMREYKKALRPTITIEKVIK